MKSTNSCALSSSFNIVDFANDFKTQNENMFDQEMVSNNSNYSICSQISDLDASKVEAKDAIATGLMCLFFSGKLTQNSFNLISEWSRILTKDESIPSNINMCVKTIINKNKPLFKKFWYCNKCLIYTDTIDNKLSNECPVCKSKLQMDYKLNSEDQLKRIFSNNRKDLINFKPKFSDIFIQDFCDGKIYNEIYRTESKSKFYTLLLNTDGIELAQKSKLSIWPIILVINELPIGKRFCFNNIVIGGLSVSNGKPNLGFLLNMINSDLKKFEIGFNIGTKNFIHAKFFLSSFVSDKPARSSVLNTVSTNGYFGCLKCLQPGNREKTKNNGTVQTYPFNTSNPSGPKRTIESYESHLDLVILKQKTKFGIKDKCILSELKYFHPIRNTLIDSMHTISNGVIKLMFSYWFEKPKSQPYSLRERMEQIDERIKRFRVPSYVCCKIRSIFTWNLWKSHEYLNFILIGGLIIFYEIMNVEYYNNLILLAKKIIEMFLKDLKFLYDPLIMKSGMHELIHLSEMILDFGPINGSNCYQFEEINRKIVQLIKGQNLIGEEFIRLFYVNQNLESFNGLDYEDQSLGTFIKNNCKIKTSNYKHPQNLNDDIRFSKSKIKFKSNLISNYLKSSYNVNEKKLICYDYVFFNNVQFCTIFYKGKLAIVSKLSVRKMNKRKTASISSQLPSDAVCSDSEDDQINPNYHWKKKKIMEDVKNTNNKTSFESQNVRIEAEFCLIEHDSPKKMEIIKATNVNLGNNQKVKTGNGFFIKENNILRSIKILYIGSRKDCDEQLKFLCDYEQKINNKTKTKNKVLSINDLNKIQKNTSQCTDNVVNDLKDKIEELESALIEKDLYIKNLEKNLKREQDINESFRNTYNEAFIKKSVSLSLNCLKLFGKREDLIEIPFFSDENELENHFIWSRYSDVTITSNQKLAFDNWLKLPSETDTAIFRRLICIIIENNEEWAVNNGETMFYRSYNLGHKTGF
ncbi:unnamed protein product [Brachionus calyciflorus]|uniref:Uncharacterized protein n=1 Tax=Brachionus calyciflorus TaxID=104777 RepID=A0A814J7G6_9BILA|nr:unnamed protein product [Brachionus calyciflorus]